MHLPQISAENSKFRYGLLRSPYTISNKIGLVECWKYSLHQYISRQPSTTFFLSEFPYCCGNILTIYIVSCITKVQKFS